MLQCTHPATPRSPMKHSHIMTLVEMVVQAASKESSRILPGVGIVAIKQLCSSPDAAPQLGLCNVPLIPVRGVMVGVVWGLLIVWALFIVRLLIVWLLRVVIVRLVGGFVIRLLILFIVRFMRRPFAVVLVAAVLAFVVVFVLGADGNSRGWVLAVNKCLQIEEAVRARLVRQSLVSGFGSRNDNSSSRGMQ